MTRPKGGRSSIFVANVDGTGGYSLANDDYIDQAPAWSPDGMQLAFVSYRAARLPGGETGYPGTFIMDANDTAGTTVRQVGDVFDVEPDWSPDGTQLAVSNTAWTGGLLRLIDVSTGVGTALENPVFGQHPSWSSDGNNILHQHYNENEDAFVIFVADVSGTNTGLLYSDGYFPAPLNRPLTEPLPTCSVTTLHYGPEDPDLRKVNMRARPGNGERLVHQFPDPTPLRNDDPDGWTLVAQGWREDADGWQWTYVWDPDNSLFGWIRHDLLAGLILTEDGGCADLRRVTLDGQAEDPFASQFDYELPNPAVDPWNSSYACSSADSNDAREGCAQVTYAAFYNGFSSTAHFGRAPRLSDLLNRLLRLEVGTVFEENPPLAGRVLKNNYWQFARDYECDAENPCSEEVIVSLWLSGVQSLYKYGNPSGSGVLAGFDEWFLNPPRYQMGALSALTNDDFEGCLGGGGTGPCEWGNYGYIDNNIRPSDLPNTYEEIVSGNHADNTFYCYVRRAYFDKNLNGEAPSPSEGDVWVDEIFAVTGPTVGKTWPFRMLINEQLNQPPWLLVTTKETIEGELQTVYGSAYRRNTLRDVDINAVRDPCPANAD